MALHPSDITDLVHLDIDGAVGRIHLNRPKALNSINTDMCLAVCQALVDWETNDQVQTVVITGEGRGLCAGGDVVAVRANRIGGISEDFFRVEYGMIKLIAAYSKPIVPIMHGIVMGGGLGISAHASHRVVCPSTKTAMPEGRIGFWTDVGMTWPLTHKSPGETGIAFALTGAIANAEETIGLGLADVCIDDEHIPEVLARLTQGEHPDAVLGELGSVPDLDFVIDRRIWIDQCFVGDNPAEMIARLAASSIPEAHQAYETLMEYSPLSLKVITKALRLAQQAPSLNAVLDADLAIATHFTQANSDFDEGVRAQLVDKDKTPHWIYPNLASVPSDVVDAFFTNAY